MDKTVRKLSFIGFDELQRDVYVDEEDIIWKNVSFSKVELYSTYKNEFYGEPYRPIKTEFEFAEFA